jgi:hypothetical protein
MKMIIGRRSLLTGLVGLVAAPAIIRAGSLMPVKQMIEPIKPTFVMDDFPTSIVFYTDGRERMRISKEGFTLLGVGK